jgi:hypothetical protein
MWPEDEQKRRLIQVAGVFFLLLLLASGETVAGDFSVKGSYPRKPLKEGAASKDFYKVESEKALELEITGPQSLVLLVRLEKAAKVELVFTLDQSQVAKKDVPAGPRASKGIFLSVAGGKHHLEVKGSSAMLVHPVAVKRNRPLPGEETLAFAPRKPPEEKPELKPAAEALLEEAEKPLPPPPPPPPPEEKAEAVSPPPPPPVAPVPPPAAAPEAVTPRPEETTAPPVEKFEVPYPQQASVSAQPEPGGVEERLVSEKKIEPQPSPEAAGIGYFGQRGVFRSWSALPYSEYSVVVGSTVEYFRASGFLAEGDRNERLLGKLVAAGVPYHGLEISAGFSLSANSNTTFQPGESQSIGDPFLSLRYGYRLLDWFAAGGGVQAVVPTGKGFAQLSTEGISTRILFAFDFMPLPEALITLNAGYHFDNSRFVFDYPLTEAQRFSAGINPHDQVLLNLGFGWHFGPVAPFLEYGAAIAVGSDVNLGFSEQPTWLTLGLRAFPLRFHTMQVLAAVDIGLTGIHPPAGAGRIPPYNVILALGYDFGAAPPPAVIEKQLVRVEKVEASATRVAISGGSRVVGRVLDAASGKPIGGARVVMGGDEPAIFLSDPEEGRFYTCPMTPGPVKLSVYREGYQEESQVVLVTEKPETPVTIKLQATTAAAFGTIKGTVRAVTGLPLPALISIPARNINLRANRADGAFEQKLETGSFDVLISMPGYVTQRRKVKLEAGDVIIINVELYPKK